MNEEKRKIGEYTVLCSVNVGEKEVILASNEQSTNGDKYMCGFAERNDLFELCSECMVSDDYIEIVHLFGSRVANEAELFKEQVEKLDIPITLITEADCIPDHYSKDINGKIIAIDPKVLKSVFICGNSIYDLALCITECSVRSDNIFCCGNLINRTCKTFHFIDRLINHIGIFLSGDIYP